MKSRRFLVIDLFYRLRLCVTSCACFGVIWMVPGAALASARKSISGSKTTAHRHESTSEKGKSKPEPELKTESKLETYQDLIEKAQNLTLQRDRLQASQLLIRGIHKESRNSVAYKELIRALDSLSALFYTEKAHGLFSSAEAMVDAKPKEAADTYAEALRLEDSNLSLLMGLARAYLISGECGKADSTVAQAEGVHPFSSEVRLLRLQVLNCQKDYEQLSAELSNQRDQVESLQKFKRGLELAVALQEATASKPQDFKRVRALLAAWENKDREYPELYFWKWKYAQALSTNGEVAGDSMKDLSPEASARAAAIRYTQLCQSLTPRKRRSYSLDVSLCHGGEEVDAFLKANGQTPAPLPPTSRGH